MQSGLVDRIYECSFVPDLWPGVLDELAALTDSRGGLLFSVRSRVLKWTASDRLSDIFRSYVEDGWFPQCKRRVCLFGQTEPSFFVEHDFWTSEEIDTNPIYRDFFRPHGLGWSAGTGLQMPTGDNIVFSVERDFSRGPIERERVTLLNELRGHLARSAFVAARLGLQRAKGASDTLSAMGLPALLLGLDGTVIEANAQIADMPTQLQWRANNRVALLDSRANELLGAALAALNNDPAAAVRSFPLRDAEDKAVSVAHIVPVRRTAQDIFAGSYALLVITPVTTGKAPPVELLRSLFDLTASEARVARGLVAGQTLEEIAASGGVAISTIRTQVRQVLEKTGCTRQAEVVSLLANISLGPGSANAPSA
ncbi:LuxR family transcriptional regulator [Tardiphaga alba]|uniref:LuxR family transcriptional regulator n=1 Tax=Tardiphaga alba TaxID=340268 RepID=A0ABX8A5D1_9BRAD|nr:helix-turn-helix transcriptional regulator [Tardiphaga alba]QUS38772.1 LuxR family transcriptional regulator [Tardiphaga alba]